jgi:hypothetical protein
VGQPAVLAPGRVIWAAGDRLRVLGDAGTTSLGTIGDVDLVEPDPSGTRLAWDDGSGVLQLRTFATGETRTLQAAGPGSHPAWSSDGALLLQRSHDDSFVVVDAATGTRVASTAGSNPAWVPGKREVVFEQRVTGSPEDATSPYTVVASSLWSLDLDTGTLTPLLQDRTLHPRYPTPVGSTGALMFVDSITGDLWRLADGAVSQVLAAGAAGPAEAPPPDYPATSISVPYMHQLWDTPDDFDGGWSCGPTSNLQVIARWGNLPTADMAVSWPYAHTSHWGWYVPNNYSFNGYTYDTWGVAASSDCQGAHGFVCREYGGAVWSYMVTFMQQHGVDSAEVGTNFDSVVSETNGGYPMYASTYVLGYGHILAVRGYLSDGGSPIHSLVVNDPYGNAGSGDWGNFDGEGIVYDWPGYNNGHLEIDVKELFTAHGTFPATPEEDEDPTPVVDTGTAAAPDTGTSDTTEEPTPDAPQADPVSAPNVPGSLTSLSDLGGCDTAPGAPIGWTVLAALVAVRRRAGDRRRPGPPSCRR